jgi:hypothetical protein
VNVFLQCKAIASLPWKELGEDGPITLYIGPTLQREIDRLKGDGSGRRSKRARDTNSLFKKLLRAPEVTMVLQEAAPRVMLTFLPLLDPQRQKSPLLDLSNPDDCHIEEALAFRAAHVGIRTSILTHDTGPLLTSRRVGLDPLEVPDAWLLEPEKDERQKEIEALTRKVKLLEAEHARLSVVALTESNAAVEELNLSVVEYDTAPPEVVASVLDELRNRYPRQEDFTKPPEAGPWSLLVMGGFPRRYKPPSQATIDKYNEAYEAWPVKVDAFLSKLPERLMRKSRHTVAVLRLQNTGTKTAQSVQIDFTASPGFLLRPVPEDGKKDDDKAGRLELKLPQCPVAPEGEFIDAYASLTEMMAGFPNILSQEAAGPAIDFSIFDTRPVQHDSTAFYYRGDRPAGFAQSISLTCQNFRHQFEPEDFKIEVQWQSESRPMKGAIRCRVFAENLPTPIEHVLPIRVTLEGGNIITEIEHYRPGSLRSFLFRGTP